MKNTAGFTLIEALLSIFVISVMFVMFQVATTSFVYYNTIRDQDRALRAANAELESLRALPYASLPGSGAFSNAEITALPNGRGVLTANAFNSQTKQMTATVTWFEPGGVATSTVSLTTLITQGGL